MMEHRWGERFAVRLPIHFVTQSTMVRRGRLTNLSLSGGFIEGDIQVSPPAQLRVGIAVTHSFRRDIVHLDARVTRKDDMGIGIEWCEFAHMLFRSIIFASTQRMRSLRAEPPASGCQELWLPDALQPPEPIIQ